MSTPPKPCAHCGNLTFHSLPDMQVEVCTEMITVLGKVAHKKVAGRYWTFTLVICTQCGSTQTFTANAPALSQWVPGASISAVP